MAARVITITSGKGGVGKTTATANLGVALASLGYKVACIDADIGLRNLDVVMGLENRIVYNLVDVIEGRARLRQAMIKDKRLKEDLYLIPAAQTRDKTAISPSDMVRLCDELREYVDYIVVDSPAGIERGFRNAIAPADEVVIITNPEVSSVRDADRIIGLIEAENKGPGKLVVNRLKAEMVKKGDMLSPDDIIDILAIDLIGLIPEDETILISTNRGTPATLKPEDSKAGQAFRNIARRLTGEDVPFMPMEDDSSFMGKLFKSLGFKPSGAGEPMTSAKPGKSDVRPKPKPSEATPEKKEPTVEAVEAKEKPAASKPATAEKKPGPKADARPAATPEAKPAAAKPAAEEKKPEPKADAKPIEAKPLGDKVPAKAPETPAVTEVRPTEPAKKPEDAATEAKKPAAESTSGSKDS